MAYPEISAEKGCNMIEPRDTIPLPILPFKPTDSIPDRSDGVTIATDFSDGRLEATYSVAGAQVAVAYVDNKGNPRVDFTEQLHLGLSEFKRNLLIWVQAWAHAQELSVLWRNGGPRAG